MVDHSQVENCIFRAIARLNQENPEIDPIEQTATAALHGGKGPLDSLGLISFFWVLEQQIEEDFGVLITLTAGLMSPGDTMNEDPFQRVDLLVRYVAEQLEQRVAA